MRIIQFTGTHMRTIKHKGKRYLIPRKKVFTEKNLSTIIISTRKKKSRKTQKQLLKKDVDNELI